MKVIKIELVLCFIRSALSGVDWLPTDHSYCHSFGAGSVSVAAGWLHLMAGISGAPVSRAGLRRVGLGAARRCAGETGRHRGRRVGWREAVEGTVGIPYFNCGLGRRSRCCRAEGRRGGVGRARGGRRGRWAGRGRTDGCRIWVRRSR